MTTYYAACLQSIPGRDARPLADRATLIRAAQARVEALEERGWTTAAEQARVALARLEEEK